MHVHLNTATILIKPRTAVVLEAIIVSIALSGFNVAPLATNDFKSAK